MRFADDVCVVTGAGAGIGRTVAQRFAAEGGRVACVDIDSDAAAHTAAHIEADGGKARAYGCDVSRSDEVQQSWQSVETDFGEPISIVFANAGVEGPIVPFWEVAV